MPDQAPYDDISNDIRRLHSRITDHEDIVEIHSADIATILECIAAISQRLSVAEKRIAAMEGEEWAMG
jgi:hypothetical protein